MQAGIAGNPPLNQNPNRAHIMNHDQKSLQPVDVVRAWKDPQYRESLTDAQRAQLPAHPAGLIELERLDQVRGGKCTLRTNPCSDSRYKKDVEPIESALSKITAMQGVAFNWRTDEFPEKHFPDHREIGFIAQELERIIPEVVETDEDGYKRVAYANITALLVEAVKEQQKAIEDLQAALEAQMQPC